MLAEAPESLRPRQLGPPVLALTAAAAVLPSPLARPARAGLVRYAGALAAESLRTRGGWRLPIVLATMHLSWGAGLLGGLVRLLPPGRRARARPAVPTALREPASP